MKKLYVVSFVYSRFGPGKLLTARPIVASNDVELKQQQDEFRSAVEKHGHIVMGEHCIEITEDILMEMRK